MEIAGTTALVTGANRGFGRQLAAQLLARGATVYAAARNPDSVDLPGGDPDRPRHHRPRVRRRRRGRATDVHAADQQRRLVHRGVPARRRRWPTSRLEMDTHFFGTLRSPAPSPACGQRRRRRAQRVVGAVVAQLPRPCGAYSAAKAAEWSLTNALRLELARRASGSAALHVGYMDTDMARGVDAPKTDPADVAEARARRHRRR